MLVSLSGIQNARREGGVVDKVWKVLGFQAERSVEVVGGALLTGEPCLRQEVSLKYYMKSNYIQ